MSDLPEPAEQATWIERAFERARCTDLPSSGHRLVVTKPPVSGLLPPVPAPTEPKENTVSGTFNSRTYCRSCGDCSPVLSSANARQQWHREHKAEHKAHPVPAEENTVSGDERVMHDLVLSFADMIEEEDPDGSGNLLALSLRHSADAFATFGAAFYREASRG